MNWTTLSPDTQWLVINSFDPHQLVFIDTLSATRVFTIDQVDGSYAWSHDSRWLALNQGANPLVVVDIPSQQSFPIEYLTSIQLMSWSPLSQKLAFVYETSISLFDPQTQTITPIWETGFQTTIKHLAWTEDGLQLIIILQQENQIELRLISINDGSSQLIWQKNDVKRFWPLATSPDNQWAAYLIGEQESAFWENDTAGVYVISQDGAYVYQVLDTSGKSDPYAFFWISP